MTVAIILAGACALWSVFYIWTEYHWERRKFFYAKALNSLLFLSIGITAFIFTGADPGYAWLIIAALVMGFIGDLFLVFPFSAKCFVSGLAAFLVGQIIYGYTFLKFGGFMVYDIIIFAVLVGACLFAYKKSSLDLEKMKLPVLFYLLIISFMFSMAVSLIYKGALNSAATVLIAVGAALFLSSDMVLAFVRFKKDAHPALRGINLVLYYAAQVLLALSIAFFG